MRIVFVLLVATAILLPAKTLATTEKITGAEKKVLQQLKKESGNTFSISWNDDTNTPALLTGHLSKPSSTRTLITTFRLKYNTCCTKYLFGKMNWLFK